jgi:hypothetical protein
MLPEAQVRYALVAQAGDGRGYRLVFLVDRAHQYDDYGNLLPVAYAKDIWVDKFRHIDMEGSPTFAWTNAAFDVRLPDVSQQTRQEFIPPTRKPTEQENLGCAIAGACVPEAFGAVVNYYDLTHYLSRFVLEMAREYRDIIYLEKAVPLYGQADRLAPEGEITAGSFVAVLTEGVDWMEVEQVSWEGHSTRGWVNRDDFVEMRWVEQQADTEAFRFRVAYPSSPEGAYQDPDERADPIAIEVLDRATGQRVQVIRDFYSESRYRPGDEAALTVMDANFDGWPDLSIPASDGGAGPNSSDNFFLFDPQSGTFVYNEELSNLTQTFFNTEQQTIGSAARGSCCDHSASTWRFIDGQLTEVANWHEFLTWDADDNDQEWMETSTCELVESEMRCETTRALFTEP